jgi:hypothetical protein
MLPNKLLCLDIYALQTQNEFFCPYIFLLCSKILLLCSDVGVICVPFLKKKFILGKRWGFWGFNNEPPQGMLCLVIGYLGFIVRK